MNRSLRSIAGVMMLLRSLVAAGAEGASGNAGKLCQLAPPKSFAKACFGLILLPSTLLRETLSNDPLPLRTHELLRYGYEDNHAPAEESAART